MLTLTYNTAAAKCTKILTV